MSLPNNPSQYEVVKAIKDLETNKVDSSALSSYLPKSGGTMTGALTSKDITLYSESGDSPRLTFQRGTLTDTYNDWSIYDTAGLLHIQQRGSGSSAWEDRATITQSGATFVGTLNAGTLQEGGTNLSNKYLGKTATATDSTKLDGQASSYYLDYNNFANTPTIPTKTSDLTNDSGYTSNTGTVTSVGAGTGLSISGTASVNPTVNVASGYKLPTTTEWNAKANASAIPTNYVTTNTAQTISGAKTFTRDITAYKSALGYNGFAIRQNGYKLGNNGSGSSSSTQGMGTYVVQDSSANWATLLESRLSDYKSNAIPIVNLHFGARQGTANNPTNYKYAFLDLNASSTYSWVTVDANDVRPSGNGTTDLGMSDYKWRNIYGTNVYATSDRRLKENIKDAELDCGAVIDELPIKEFNFKSDEEKKVVVGAIAQELKEILPEKYRATLVSGSEDTSYSINEGKLLYVAIGALKEERAKTKELEERLAKLEKMLGV